MKTKKVNEIETTKEIKKWGDSLVVILTDEKKIMELKEGMLVKMRLTKL